MEPTDAALALFQSDDGIVSPSTQLAIPEFGRSGRELRHSFLLRAPEKSGEDLWPWSIRQVAVYHAFDVEKCKSLWITVKGNNLLQARIRDDTKDLPILRANAKADLASQWEAALATHLIYFRYAEENWRWVVRDMEGYVRGQLAKAKTAPIVAKIPLSTSHLGSRQLTQSSTLTQKSHSDDVVSARRYALKFVVLIFGKGFEVTSRLLKLPPYAVDTEKLPVTETADRSLRVLSVDTSEELRRFDVFNYTDLQELNVTGGIVEELLLVLKLNLDTLRDVYRYFEQVQKVSNRILTQKETEETKKATSQFLTKLHYIIRSLETREAQLQSLGRQLKEGIALASILPSIWFWLLLIYTKQLENILQFRSLEIEQSFAELGHRSNECMHQIAVATRRETVSMNIITIMTLMFLPGTFIAVRESIHSSMLLSSCTDAQMGSFI